MIKSITVEHALYKFDLQFFLDGTTTEMTSNCQKNNQNSLIKLWGLFK